MSQYPFEFKLTLMLEDLYELQDFLESHDNELLRGISEDLTRQLNEQLKNF